MSLSPQQDICMNQQALANILVGKYSSLRLFMQTAAVWLFCEAHDVCVAGAS